MEYVNSNEQIIKKEKNELLFTRTGELTNNNREKYFAKILNGENPLYYIRTYQGTPYDPLGSYSRREVYSDTKLHKVSKNTFDFYIMYLNTNNSIYLTKAQRGLVND